MKIKIHDLRDYSENKHKKIDDYSYGGEAGMVLKIEPIAKCIQNLKKKRKYDTIIYITPDGDMLNQKGLYLCILHRRGKKRNTR